MTRPWLPILLVAGLLSACGSRAPAPVPAPAAAPAAAPDGRARATRLLAAAAGLATVTGRTDRPGGVASWRGYLEGAELRLLEEQAAGPGGVPLENRYYFEHGALFYYRGEQPAAAGSGAAGAAPRVPVEAEFRGTQVLRAVRIEHYGPVPLEPAAVAAIRRRAAELASAAHLEQGAAVKP